MTKLHDVRTTLRTALLLLLVFVLSWPANLRVASAADNHANMPGNRQLLRAVTMSDGKVMVTGGNDGMSHSAATFVYDPEINTWATRASMGTPRFSHAMVLLQSGRVMAIGGNNFSTGVMNSVEIYDPMTNTWSAAAPMSVQRASHVAATLPDGRVLVAGGENDNGDLSSTEIYDPATNTWTAGPSMPTTRKETGAALLGDGRVLLAGGAVGGTMSSSAIVYDAATNSWSSVANLPTQRYVHAMTSLEDGRVSVSGGFDPNYSPLANTVIYDPDTNSWSTGPNMNVGVLGHDAVLLHSGKVFVVGGSGNSGPSSRSESHHPTPRTPLPKVSVAAGEVTPGTNVTLSTYISGLTIHYTTDGSTPTTASPVYSAAIAVNEPMTVKAIAHHSSWGSSQVMTVSYTMPRASTPAAAPANGEVVRGTTVELSSATSGAVIHYTTDGSTPTAASPIYEGPIAINAAMTLKAIAVNDGMANSFVMSEAYTLIPTKPDAPVISGVTRGDGIVDVAFTLAYDGSSTVTGYTVTSSGGQTATGTSSPITVTGLTNGTAYTFTVTATNAIGISDSSAASSSVTPARKPDAPTGVTAERGNGQATVSFEPPADNGGSAVTGYTVTSSGGQTATGTSSPITVTGLTNGTSYTFTVTATNEVGTSDSSAASSSVTPATVSGAPSNVTAVRGNGQATVSFDPPAGNGGSAVTQYTVTSSGGQTATGSSSPITVTGLTNGTSYTFTVTATNAVGDSAASAASSAVTPATVPEAPSNVTAVRGNGQAAVSFDVPADNGSAITQYTVTSSGGQTATGASSPITVTGLTNGTSYTFTVTATNAVGESASSAASSAVTPATVPGAPTNVTAVRGNGQATVTFNAPADNGSSAITQYTVTSSGGQTATGSSSPITVTGLTNGTSYTFTVTATNAVGESASSAASAAVTPATVPGAPTNVTAVRGNEQATVSFNVPADDGGSAVTQYTVTSSGGQTATGSSSPITVTGLTNGTAYTFTVTATNAVGESASSAASSAVTPATVPGVPTGITANAGNGQATVSFDPPVDNGGSDITQYTVTSSGGQTATGSSSPITVTGLTNGTAYTFTVTATNEVGSSNASDSSSPVIPYVSYVPDTGVEVLVNGKRVTLGTQTTSQVNGRQVITISIDEAKLTASMDKEERGAIITIPIPGGSDVASGELTGRTVQSMSDKSAIIVIMTETGSYSLPAQQINVSDLAEKFGDDAALEDIKIQIEISTPTEETAKVVEQVAGSGEFQLVVPAVEYTVTATYGTKTLSVERFGEFVERTIAIPDGVDPAKITTGVVVEQDGAVRHVPTRITLIDGRYYVVINSLTNSIYSAVWHPVVFKDTIGHWAEEEINDLGSRMVISGTDDRSFLPQRNVTRAEFAAMLVRALGLKPDASGASFSDVDPVDWYAGYVGVAAEYGLVQGFDASRFRPDATITREQAMVMMAKALRLTGGVAQQVAGQSESAFVRFEDSASISSWAADSVALLIEQGLVNGFTDNLLAPKAYITRAEAAVIIRRLLKQSELI